MTKPPFTIGLKLNHSPEDPYIMLCIPTQKEHAEAIHEAILETLPALQKRFIWAETAPTLNDLKNQVYVWKETYQKEKPQQWDRYTWMILSQVNDLKHALSGIISLTRTEENKDAYEFGYWIREGHQGKGIVSHAVKVLINNVEAEYFRIRCAADNEASKNIAKKFGFKYSHTQEKALQWKDGRNRDMMVFIKR